MAFSEDTRCKIIADYLGGKTQHEIAATYGCHPTYPPTLARRAGYPMKRSKATRRRMGKSQRQTWRQRKFSAFMGSSQ